VLLLAAGLAAAGRLTVGDIAMAVLLCQNVVSPVRALHRVIDEQAQAQALGVGFYSLHDMARDHGEAVGPDAPTARGKSRLRGHIEFDHVSFGYAAVADDCVRQVNVLRDVSLQVLPGQTVALVGRSGAGKTTLANHIPAFLVAQQGEVRIDGRSVCDYDREWLRHQIGVVFQRNHVSDDATIRECRLFGDAGTGATEEDLRRAIDNAGLTAVVARIGLDSPAGRLSEGEKQRVAIARAFLKDPPILVLDEPTASLDAEVTAQVKAALDRLRAGRSVLVISHNLPLVADADRIYVLDGGCIVEQGVHEELMAAHAGVYRGLIDSTVNTLNLPRLLLREPRSQACSLSGAGV
jgi:ABC-type multidrug transport system fused ATPase/permease subunit